MSRGTYLQQIARRAIQDTPRLLRPRRLMRAPRATPPDEPVLAARVPVAVLSNVSAVDPTPPLAPAPVGPTRASSAKPRMAPEPIAPSVTAASAPPSGADFVPAIHRRDSSSASDAAEESVPGDKIQRLPPMEPSPIPPAHRTPPIAKEPTEPRRPMAPRRNVPDAPDPLAVALAAAVRWTSSEERPDPIAATRPAHERPATEADHREEPIVGAARETPSRDTPSRATPPRDLPARVTPVPRAEAVAAIPGDRSTPASTAERFTGIHIGSVEVHILPPPEPVAPPVPRPRAVSTVRPVTPLARGLSSSIGLRQS